ncbi:MAG: hypothetical protein QOE79_560 [Sphingomonadales bacterium]|nr:hypothetical protein [Sphingomonadales bacterium]
MDTTSQSENDTVQVVTTSDVLLGEYRQIWANASPPTTLNDYFARVNRDGQAALCLSGGGIRSASFALGVMEALACKGLLTRFHYLSTVSGGGYIGGFLQRWILDAKHDAGTVMTSLAGEIEPDQIKHLRENSNFITPKVGLGSNDTWTAVAISLRNILLNWLLLGPLLMLATVLPNIFYSGALSMDPLMGLGAVPRWVLMGLTALSCGLAAWFMCRGLPSYSDRVLEKGSGDRWYSTRIVLPLIVWAVTGTLLLACDFLVGPVRPGWHGVPTAASTFAGMAAGLILSGFTLPPPRKDSTSDSGARALDDHPSGQRPKEDGSFATAFADDLLIWLLAIATMALLTVAAAWLVARCSPAVVLGEPGPPCCGFKAADPPNWTAGILVVAAPIWLMLTHFIAMIVFVGFRNPKNENVKPDSDREWLARLSAVKAKPILLWAIAAGSALLLNWWVAAHLGHDITWSSVIAALSGAAAVKGGKSAKSGNASSEGSGSFLKLLPAGLIISIATFVFLIALFVLLARAEMNAALAVSSLLMPLHEWQPVLDPVVMAHWALAMALLILPILLSQRVRVNRFSLNGLYRNRLDRAFLGAARIDRKASPFTGFSARDNVRMTELLAPTPQVLYPVVNVALNVTATENLAWQERKAEPFIFTPLYSGSSMLNPPGVTERGRVGAYVGSSDYGGNEPDYRMEGTGVTLASAIAISGAAASPNMGYHSSPATALLMTLFNVRLGAWLPNPSAADKLGDKIGGSEPSNPLRALLNELTGSTTDTNYDIYLSDGGHFENLAVYEMLRRRCRYIVVSDAGADPQCAFEDLGGLVRKAKIDFDTTIRFPELRLGSRDEPFDPKDDQLAWAFGTIQYPNGIWGQILYLKPSFFGKDLPADIKSYGNGSKTFPHETTGDQFFSESQFESYRHLGFFFMEKLATNATTIADLFRGAPPVPPPAAASASPSPPPPSPPPPP